YNKTLRDIAWSQSHEVRAPLMRLLGLASLIKDMEAGISVELQEILDMMVASVEDLDQVVKKINEKTNIT
ncbi:MAG TPA: histidine kinase dimerization/phospho-acceptor domain-containing protein, partial [Niabella sp.]|nr:histidine kinase dimerization/phospho-acceptor domain-containing protein [Niabella sp.]